MQLMAKIFTLVFMLNHYEISKIIFFHLEPVFLFKPLLFQTALSVPFFHFLLSHSSPIVSQKKQRSMGQEMTRRKGEWSQTRRKEREAVAHI